MGARRPCIVDCRDTAWRAGPPSLRAAGLAACESAWLVPGGVTRLAEARGRAGAGLGGLLVAVAGRGRGDERCEQLVGRLGHRVHGPVEGRLVGLGGPGEAA